MQSASFPPLLNKLPSHLERSRAIQTSSPVRSVVPASFQGAVQKNDTLLTRAIHPPRPRYGRFENNLREVLRVTLVHGLPIALAPISLAGIPGLMLTLAFMPLLYIAGKIGRHIGRHVDRENLAGTLKLFHRIRELFDPKLSEAEKIRLRLEMQKANTPEEREAVLKKFGHRNHVDKINGAFRDFALGARLPAAFSSFVRDEKYRSWLLQTLKVDEKKRLGRFVNAFINNKTLFKNQIFSEIAQSKSTVSALGTGVRGAKDWYVDFKLMPKVGNFVGKVGHSKLVPGFMRPLLQGAGVGFKNWFVTKSAWDAAMAVRKRPS